MYNKVSLIGHLGKDPEVRRLESGAVVAKFSLATSESYRDKAGEWQTLTEWHDIVLWRGLAERAERDLKKGSLAFVEGKLTTRKWQDKEGNNRYTTEVVAQLLKPLDKRESSGEGYKSFPTAIDEGPTTSKQFDAPSTPAKSETPKVEEDDDLPF
ncbi:MAG: single-stranded DNA-binding protein [Saprospiraceae bacterium]|nr:single-stranded DNA-binding protein [Bacteroidia bacterium]NNE13395.1 single-stranded DNA-binding protein [Saprospiraceae bacterium]NNL92997.1 single-stranded DNA-binding protein [Saprospiraceae bacterium]